eukprot:TRINITY_DN7963_c0_g1_i1.p1 TRINITY_DN7963_c0_g1~~TRINITY_DN7963_c0_g1_i1.p1  ORF type:complete len:380 (-),score=64.14 TRINITY_DN7963_c0_g1_i1:214-1203(-)
MCEMLLSQGASVALTDRKRNTPLHAAARSDLEICRLLLLNGAAVNAQNDEGNTALHMACLDSYKLFAELLLKYGADPAQKNNHNLTPLEFSKRVGSADSALEQIFAQTRVVTNTTPDKLFAAITTTDQSIIEETYTFVLSGIHELRTLPDIRWPRLRHISLINCPEFSPKSLSKASPTSLTSIILLGTSLFALADLKDLHLVELVTNTCTDATLPENCSLVQSLKLLDFSNSPLCEIPQSIYQLRVSTLTLAGAPISAMPPLLSESPIASSLTIFNINRTKVCSLPDGFEHLQRLQHFHVIGVPLQEPPWVVAALPMLSQSTGMISCPF